MRDGEKKGEKKIMETQITDTRKGLGGVGGEGEGGREWNWLIEKVEWEFYKLIIDLVEN